MYKKIIKFVCLILMFNFLFIVVNVKAVYNGGSQTHFVRIKEVKNVKSGSITISYDTTGLYITDAYWDLDADIEDFDKETNKGKFIFSNPTTIDDLIFVVKFKVKLTSEEKRYDIKIDIKLTNDYGEVTRITETSWYDVECTHIFDGRVVDDKYFISEATCSEPAKYYISCSYCGIADTSSFSAGETLPHKFDKKIEEDSYIAEDGTCTTKNKYYYACSVCGKKGTTTYEGSEEVSHRWIHKWYANDENHWHQCYICNMHKDEEAHEFNDYEVIEVPTIYDEGVGKYTCICGEEKFELIPKIPSEETIENGCKKDLSILVVGVISLSMVGVLLKRKEN